MQAMVRTLLAAAPSDELCEVLIDKSEGNPLYVEEIVRQLQETDGIVVQDGAARLLSGSIAVPSTIHDIIAARVDRLAEALKPTLQTAAVIGRRFGIPLLCRVLDGEAEFVSEHLSELHRLDFIFPDPRDAEPMYSFKHALTQDVVYAGLLERRRREYHAAAGAGLEEIYANRIDEVVELLGHHFGRSAEDDKAVDYAIRAGEKAQQRWANTEALAAFEIRSHAPGYDARHRGQSAAPDRRDHRPGRDQVRPRPSRRARPDAGGHPRAGRRVCRSAAPGRVVLLGGISPQPHGRAAGDLDRLLPGGRRHFAGGGTRDSPTVRGVRPVALLLRGRRPARRRSRPASAR